MRGLWPLLKETYNDWSRHQAPKLGAALAYYTILSLAPLVIVVIAVIGLVFGHQAAQGQIMGQIQGMVGQQGAEAIQAIVAASSKPKTGTVATILGLITLFLGASGVFVELRDSLNKIWEVPLHPDAGIWSMIRERFLSFGMVLAIGFLLLVSLVVSAAIAAAGAFMGGVLPIPAWILQIVNQLISLAVFTAVFALIYKFLPDESITWRDTFLGAAFTSILFTIGKYLIGLYLGRAGIASAYGAAGSLVLVLVWVYYSAQVFFFGAEFTHVFALRHGSHSPAVHGSTSVVTVPAHITGDGTTEATEAAAGGAKLNVARTAGIGLAAVLGGLGWWRGRSKDVPQKRA
jgi:membrane protein